MGLPHAVAVTTADVTDRDRAIQMLLLNLDNLSHVEKFLVDGGYSGERFANQVKDICGAQVEVVKRSELEPVFITGGCRMGEDFSRQTRRFFAAILADGKENQRSMAGKRPARRRATVVNTGSYTNLLFCPAVGW